MEASEVNQQPFSYTRNILLEGYDGNTCRIDGLAFTTPDQRTHICYRHILLDGSDVFVGNYVISSSDGGKTFSEPQKFDPMPDTYENGIRTNYTLLPYYHRFSNSIYTVGRVTRYVNDKEPLLIGRDIMPAITGDFDSVRLCFNNCTRIELPDELQYDVVSFMQPYEKEDGTVLIPAYIRYGHEKQFSVIVVQFAVSNGRLEYLAHGSILKRNDLNRGLYEPRITGFQGHYYLTIRTDESAFIADSNDGLHFSEPEEWIWDDGEKLGSYNTQQAWLNMNSELYLVYTRKTSYNSHIFRNRAPLFMARFDPVRKCTMKETELIAVPEMGARLGNFYVTNMNEHEAWICVSEWMQPVPQVCESYGARNRLWQTRITWNS